jgi:predicted O-methyltransferase YrrM
MVGREIVPTMQSPAQRVVLGVCACHYAIDRPIIEIGSALGGSGLLLTSATAESREPLYSIDPDIATRDIMRFAFVREGYGDRLVQIMETSDKASTYVELLEMRAGLVFIDGLHTVDGVRSDIENYLPLVANGGAVLFHDVCPQIFSVLRVVMDEMIWNSDFQMRCLVDGLAVFERM